MSDTLDNYINNSYAEAMNLISSVLDIPVSQITGIKDVKSGMTNHSFSFTADGRQYICRVPGEGSNKLVNRINEHESIEAVKALDFTENIIYHSAETGYKIAEYYPDARLADKNNDDDMRACMSMIRRLHDSKLTVGHDFDVAKEILSYENLCLNTGGILFEDYDIVRKHSLDLIVKLASLKREKRFCHVDCNPDNCLFTNSGAELKVIDWEYSGMADPLLDIAAVCIYSYYDKTESDRLMGFYFEDVTPSDNEKGIVYAYMALLGLCWALWAVYKMRLGVNFGEYIMIQYGYARDFYKEAMALL